MQKYTLVIIISLTLFTTGLSQTTAKTRCNSLGKGVNLSNWLEAFWDPNWPDTAGYNKQFFLDMKAAGVQSLRMPTCFALVTGTQPPYTVDTTNRLFSIIDTVIAWTTELNMHLIIDNQHQWNVADSNWRIAQPRLAHLWSVLAQRYNHLDPNRYFFEIFNEPNGINNDSLPLLYTPIIDTIRQYAPQFTIVASPNDWSNGFGYYSYKPLADTNLMYTFHSYDPYEFTHQGLTFVQPPLPVGVPFPGSEYDQLVEVNWYFALQFHVTYNVPVFLGEFGVGDSADAVSRCHWADSIGTRIDDNHLSAFYWDVRGDFQIYRSGVTTQDSIIPCFAESLHWYNDSLSAVQNVEPVLPVNIYPNPANTYFTCTTPTNQPVTLLVYNSTGACVYQTKFTNQTTINTQAWAKGLYVVKVIGTAGVSMGKVVVD